MPNNPKRLITNKGTVPEYITKTGTVSSAANSNIVVGVGTTWSEDERRGLLKVNDWIYVDAKNVVGTLALRKIIAILDDTHLKIESRFETIAGVDSPIAALSAFTIVRASRAVEISYYFQDGAGGVLNGITVPVGFSDTDTKASKSPNGQDFIDPIAVDGKTAGVITEYLTF